MWTEANRSAERLAEKLHKVGTAGSDSHTLAGVALTYTEVPRTCTVEEYLAGLRAGRGVIHGEHGCYTKITADIFRFVGNVLRENHWALALLPLTPLIPGITAAHWLNEIRFCKHWKARLEREEKKPRMLWDVDSGFGANWAS
jgi:hypothetical protein